MGFFWEGVGLRMNMSVLVRSDLHQSLIVDNVIQTKMIRRNRKDLVSRDFHCPCGKAYLSYPALHTHIKKYHEKPETVLEKATLPHKEKGKRGRPINLKHTPVSQQFDELNFIQTSILRIYQFLSKEVSGPILLEGNEEQDQKTLQQEYRHRLCSEASNELELLAPEQLREYEEAMHSLSQKLTKHFTLQVSVRLKVMLVIGYVQHQIEGARREECLAKMAAFGWGPQQRPVADVLFDVLMRALQRQNREQSLFTSNES